MKASAQANERAATQGAAEDRVEAARSAGLRYVTDAMPGIRRIQARTRPVYRDLSGKPVRSPEVLGRIRSLVIPPAWTEVWICPSPDGHLQATGRDARGRKQHRYHPRWLAIRDATKFDRMIAFGKALPRLRRRVAHDLAGRTLSRERVLATIVSLLERTLIRVGNEEYARQNQSFGLTTLRNRHVDVAGGALRFEFRGKRGIAHTIGLRDARLARIVRACQELPGHELFQWVDADGARAPVDSSDVNDYVRTATGEDFTSKDFRTWAGTVLAAQALGALEPFESDPEAKRCVAQAIESVARQLGNTKAVCRRSYVHPAVIDAYFDRSLAATFARRSDETAQLPAPRHQGGAD